jgi:uncharacterized protein (DUF697 family)
MLTVSMSEAAAPAEIEITVSDDKINRSAEIISNYVKWSAAAGAVPVPLLDTVALAVVQTKMLMDLSEVHDQKLTRDAAEALVSVLLGALLPTAATGMLLGSTIKYAPVIGTVAGMATMAALGSAATYAVGKVFARHLIKGGKIAEFNADAIKAELKAEFNDAKSKSK